MTDLLVVQCKLLRIDQLQTLTAMVRLIREDSEVVSVLTFVTRETNGGMYGSNNNLDNNLF